MRHLWVSGPFSCLPVHGDWELPGWWSSQRPHRKQMGCSSGTSPGRVIYKGLGRAWGIMRGDVGPTAGGSVVRVATACCPRASRERAEWSPERRGHGQKSWERGMDQQEGHSQPGALLTPLASLALSSHRAPHWAKPPEATGLGTFPGKEQAESVFPFCLMTL